MPISVGDRVRSFDFVLGDLGRNLVGDQACYVEGHVQDIVEREGCKCYEIRVDLDIFGGILVRWPRGGRVGNLVYSPVINTHKYFAGTSDFVELI